MKHLNSYEEYNEGIKSGLTKAGLVGSLLINSPDVKSQMANPYNAGDHRNFTNPLSPYNQLNKKSKGTYGHKIKFDDSDNSSKYEKMDSVELEKELKRWVRQMKLRAEMAEISAIHPIDDTLSNILSSIESVAGSGGDHTQFNKLFGSLTKHMKSKYGYEIPQQNIDQLDDQGIIDMKDGLGKNDINNLMGWLGSLCLALCGLPQAWSSYKDKNSHGISWAFLALWALGEIFAMIYVYGRMDLPMMLNYGANILILSVMIYYKVKPGNDNN